MSEKDYAIAYEKWRDADTKWEANLTPEQLFTHQRKSAEDDRARMATSGRALRNRLPLPADHYEWQQIAAEKKLPPETIAQLKVDHLAYGPSVKQSFEPYLGGPVFVTSDSLLNAFHVLFEDTFRQLELRQANALRGQLERLLANARSIVDKKLLPQNRMEAALRHDQLVIGPAIVLLGGSLDSFDVAVREEISTQAEKIRQAGTTELPAWLGPPDQQSLIALDYRRCKPVGFYSNSERLSVYFRAVRWLQMIPFRCARANEFDAILLLRLAYGQANLFEEFEHTKNLLGMPDDLTIEDLQIKYAMLLERPLSESEYETKLVRLRVSLTRELVENHRCLINSDLKAKSPLGSLAAQLSFRVLSPARTWDAVLFQDLIDQQRSPQGLAIAALLGSTFAEKRLAAEDMPAIIRGRENIEAETQTDARYYHPCIYSHYLHALSALFIAPPDDAPAFMKSDVWSAKNCQTALSGWAQMRHTFTLQSKANANFMGLIQVPPGFIEDNPEFFARMARLIEQSHDSFADSGCFKPSEPDESEKNKTGAVVLFGDDNPPTLQQRWQQLSRISRSLEAMSQKQLRHQPWTLDEDSFLRSYGKQLAAVMGYYGNSWLSPHDDAPRWVEVSRDVQRNVSLAAAIGRPRFFYVLYPWNGMEVLCTGSVMQYYEYKSAQRLTDAEWINLLDSPQAPMVPTWLGSQVEPPGKPVKRQR